MAIRGSIGTALFVSIGNGLAAGGPGSLLLAYSLYSLVIACVNNCIADMITLFPVSGGFMLLAGKWVDDALGFMVGWNLFLYEALLIPFEITAINLIMTSWRDDVPAAAVCAAVIMAYAYDPCPSLPLPAQFQMGQNVRHAALQSLCSTRKTSSNSTAHASYKGSTGNISRTLVSLNPAVPGLAQYVRVSSVSVTVTSLSPLGALSRSSGATR